MAGFFALPRTVFERGKQWDPIGYKIGLEILVKSGCRRTKEVPIHFADRRRGTSKLSWKQQRDYLLHLCRLADFVFPTPWRLVKYCVVGVCGAVCDLTAYSIMLAVGVPLELARALAIWIGMTTNFAGNDRLTFHTSQQEGLPQRYLMYLMTCSLGAVINYAVALSVPKLIPAAEGLPVLNAVWGILAGTWFNFWMARHWVFQEKERDRGVAPRQDDGIRSRDRVPGERARSRAV
jgi:dolichol-phosphate mannosyltransferase